MGLDERFRPGVPKEVAASSRLNGDVAPGVFRRFPSAAHLASWAGLCPGNNESAGKRRSAQITKGSPYLRAAVPQAAWPAVHTKNTYLAAQYHRLIRRMGKNKALIAGGHSLLVIIYHVLARNANYRELGGDYFERQHQQTQQHRLIKKLAAMGLKVTVETLSKAA